MKTLSKRLGSIENWHERSQCNPWCGDPDCLHIDSAGGYPDLRYRTNAMIQEQADSPMGKAIFTGALILFGLWALLAIFL